jgi:hypothetical protein
MAPFVQITGCRRLIDAQFGNTAFIPTVEDIQDLVETALMERGYFTVAKSYIIYRYEHDKIREEKKAEVAEKISENALMVDQSATARASLFRKQAHPHPPARRRGLERS